ncbi:MAG: long-chain fatty acid--CoA ligase [Thiotrichaceae bacterium]|nr:long-chain fatty acid--CoA ligase [Thiotrichaceae bacterium]
MSNPDLISLQQANNLSGLFHERVQRSPEVIAYHSFNKTTQLWQTMTWSEIAKQVAHWQAALQGENLAESTKIAIILRNCPQWVMFDQAALGLGLITVPLYTDDRPANVAYIIEESEAKILFLENLLQWKRLHSVCQELPQLQRILTLESLHDLPPELQDPRLISIADWLPAEGEYPLLTSSVDIESLASIVYTSGTTGRPKGVMLSHRNFLTNAHAAASSADFSHQDIFLSFLPLSHTLERTDGYYLPMTVGASVAYARSVQQLGSDLTTVRPTMMISVPRIYEQVYGKIQHQLQKKSPFAQKVFKYTVELGYRYFLYQQGRGSWEMGFLWLPLLRRKISEPILEKLGGRLRMAICGGAALSPSVAKLFIGLGLNLLQGYGLTETSPVICVNRPEDNVPDGVGLPLPSVQVKLSSDGELLTKSPCVTMGYWKNPEATAQLIDADGWLHTGDLVKINPQGHIKITGRIKDIIVMGNGEKVPPTDMEAAVSEDDLFTQVLIVGEGKAYLSALVVLNPEVWQSLATELQVSPEDAEALKSKAVNKAVLARISARMKIFPGYAQIRRVLILQEAWTVENGLLTPTLKIRRNLIVQKYAAEIEHLYEGFDLV